MSTAAVWSSIGFPHFWQMTGSGIFISGRVLSPDELSDGMLPPIILLGLSQRHLRSWTDFTKLGGVLSEG